MKARRAKRCTKFIERGERLAVELEELARFRRELAASDLPEAAKTVLGFLADPVGAVVDAANREMIRRQEAGEKP
jgi:hypothetical protein